MPRSFKTILACVFLVSFLAISFGAGPVQADTTTYMFYAENHIGSWCVGNFSLQYVDLDGDGKLSTEEVVPGSLSRTLYWHDLYGGQGDWLIVDLYRVPGENAGPLTDTSQVIPGANSMPWWGFYTERERPGWGYIFEVDGRGFLYSQTEVVPIPPSVFLLGAGLIGLAGWRRFRKN
jgi:hypothetical protein